MKLAIVGSRSLAGHAGAVRLVGELVSAYQLVSRRRLTIISGGAAGIDRMAAECARRRGVSLVEHLPQGTGWQAYRARNELIARQCDRLIRIGDVRSQTWGSGWTLRRAAELSKPTLEVALDSACDDDGPGTQAFKAAAR